MRGGMNGPMNGLGVAQLLGSLQGPMRSQPPPERPTRCFFLQKAAPRNLADLRSIRESESGTLLEISEKSEVLMLCMDEEYLGAQKLLKADRLSVLLFLANPHERDENLDKAQQLMSLYDFTGSVAYHNDVCETLGKIIKKHRVQPKHVLDQLRYERKKRTQKQKSQLQRKLKYMDDSEGDAEKENGARNRMPSPSDEDLGPAVRPPRRLRIKPTRNAEPSHAEPRSAVREREEDLDRLVGLPVKKAGADSMMVEGVCAGGVKKEGVIYLNMSWDGTDELQELKFAKLCQC